MLPFKLIYSNEYFLPIGRHVFPAEKYQAVYTALLVSGIAEPADFVEPEPAGDDEVLLVHTTDYVRQLKTGELSDAEIARMEVPYSPGLVKAFWMAAGGTILAAEMAMLNGIAVNVCGGFHHAFPDHAEGFCLIHDVAIAIRSLHKKGKLQRAMIVDCDVHHGNGTAAIFPPKTDQPRPMPGSATLRKGARATAQLRDSSAGAPEVFTISLHQATNYPVVKPPSSIDIHLPDGTNDEQYLAWLDLALASASREFEPQLICYLAGADPYREDQLGGLALTLDGLRQRDEMVMRFAQSRSVPLMLTLAGGYARNVEDTVKIHCNSVTAARDVFGATG